MSVLAFTSSDRRTGCSMIASCFAEEYLKKDPRGSVLLISFAAEDFSCRDAKYAGLSLSDVAPYIKKDVTDIDEVCEKSAVADGLNIISAFRPGEFISVAPDAMTEFIRSLAGRFSLVVCDVGNAAYPGGLLGPSRAADAVYEVITPGEVCLRRHEWKLGLYSQLGILFDGCILNRISRDDYVSPSEVRNRLKIPEDRFYTVRLSPFSQSAEAEGKTLLKYRDRGFSRDISAIVSDICLKI